MRLVCISDTHTNHKDLDSRLPEGDVIVHSGDFTSEGIYKEYIDFIQWYSSLPYKIKVMSPGNHDFVSEKNHQACKDIADRYGIIYLSDEEAVIEGKVFFGCPWTTYFGGWAFNEYEPQLKEKFNNIPSGCEVLITHGPPKGILSKNERGQCCGSKSLAERISELENLKLVTFGHIHEGYGTFVDDRGITYFNSSMAGNRGHGWFYLDGERSPHVFDI